MSPCNSRIQSAVNNYWSSFSQTNQFHHSATLELLSPPPLKILECGSGDGLFLSSLEGRGYECKGLDISSIAVEKANRKGVKTQVYDFGSNSLPYPDSSFDTVLALEVLEHLYDPQHLLREMYRVTKDDIIISTPNFCSFIARVQVLGGGGTREQYPT